MQIYPTKDYLSVEHALDAMASEEAFQNNVPGAAAFACAGPVLDNKCVMTNLSWVIDGQSLTIKYGIRYVIQTTSCCAALCCRMLSSALEPSIYGLDQILVLASS